MLLVWQTVWQAVKGTLRKAIGPGGWPEGWMRQQQQSKIEMQRWERLGSVCL